MPPTNSQQALSQLQTAQQQAQDPNQILQQQQQSLGVPGAQQTVTGLRGAIDNTTKLLSQVAPSVMGRTGNSLVTNAQATRQIGNEQAPISKTLTDQTSKYNQATTDLTNLQQQAKDAASGIYTGQQNKLSYLQNLYNTLYGQEQDAAKQAEQQREFDASMNAKSAAGSDSGLGSAISALLGGSGAAGGGFQAQKRSDGGFNFQDASGRPTNAVAYSQAYNIPIRTQLQHMANEGDHGAKTALDYVGNDYGVNVNKLRTLQVSPSTYNATVSLLHSLGFRV